MFFNYFKYFNEVNKVSNYIRDENNYVNNDDLLLDYIYEKRNVYLAEMIFPLVEERDRRSLGVSAIKTLLTRFINICSIRNSKIGN